MDAYSIAHLVQAHRDLDVVLQHLGKGDEGVKSLLEENAMLRQLVSRMAATLVPIGRQVSEEDSDKIVAMLLRKAKFPASQPSAVHQTTTLS